ncbi:MAG TPA: ZIP family metal transporter, partial [Candidatus Poseidoniia archaeon]|nr:ZIP family metal transporter [Candidatus Poseidoniia archaeon]
MFAAIMFVAVAMFGYIPMSLDLSSVRLKQLTAIGAGVLIGSAFLVIIPEALEIFEGHEEEEEKEGEEHEEG